MSESDTASLAAYKIKKTIKEITKYLATMAESPMGWRFSPSFARFMSENSLTAPDLLRIFKTVSTVDIHDDQLLIVTGSDCNDREFSLIIHVDCDSVTVKVIKAWKGRQAIRNSA